MTHFLDRIEQLSKAQLQTLVRAMRDEILHLRPDEFADLAPASAHVYETHWHAAPLVAAATGAAAGPLTAVPKVLLLTERGANWPPVAAGGMLATCVRAEIDPEAGWVPDAFAALLARLPGPFDAIVHAPAPTSPDAQADALPRRWSTALALAAAVATVGAGHTASARLWWLTRGAQRLPGDTSPADEALAPLAALGRTLSLEQPAVWGGAIDIDDTPGALDAALAEIMQDVAGSDDELAYRAGLRYVPVLEPAAGGALGKTAFSPSPDATYLVTGGMGGIGTVLVDHLLERGAGRVVIFGRRAPSLPDAAAWLAERRRTAGDDARVALIATDLCDPVALSRALDTVRADGPPLRAIFHAAGSNERIALAKLTREDIDRIVGAKALGAAHLDRLTRDDPLDFQVYFSSVAGSWGTAQMAPYAMANRFLDALAERREAAGLTTRSIAWGPWAEVGMMIRQRQQGFAALGLRSLAPSDALTSMARAIVDACATRQIVDVDWHRYAEHVALTKHLRPFAALSSARPKADAAAAGDAAGPAMDTAARRDVFDTPERTLALLRDLVTQLLGDALPEGGDTRPMQELGLTSLLSVELSQNIRRRLGVPCRPTVVFDFPTLRALAEALAQAWALANPSPADGGTGVTKTAESADTAEAAHADENAIAIVGMACRLPGAESPETLWAALERAARTGEDAIARQPAGRFDLARYACADDAPGKSYSLAGGLLDELERFDHARFRLSHREACYMDPQQRLALETTWRAFEDAGIDPAGMLEGDVASIGDAAVFFGIGQNEYGPLCRSVAESEDTGLMSTGQSMNIIAGRIAHLFGLDGPAICYDTACSSSLVALDAAVRHLRGARNRLAVVGGVNALVSPDTFVLLGKARALSRQGRCAAFDARADGYVRAEGCVVMVMKRLADARADADTIHAVIRGSAVNHDGRSSGLTAPSGRAQERVMRAALLDARLEPHQVALVEAHGTGTALGDPIEYHALRAVYADGVARANPLVVGALKAFVGHTEAASGLAGLLKLVLSLRSRTVPAQLHYATLNPFIDASEAIEIPAVTRTLGEQGPLIGAVSSFGFNGTNAHVIVERGDDQPSRRLSGQPFERVRCWYTARPVAQSSGLAQAFGAAPATAEPASYAMHWVPFTQPGVSPPTARRILLLHAASKTATRDESLAWRDALAARGLSVVETAIETAASTAVGGQGPFDLIVLRVDADPAWPRDTLGAQWLDRLGGVWSALARLLADVPGAPHVLIASTAPAPDSARVRWQAVLACVAKERTGMTATWVERADDTDATTLAAHTDALLAIREPVCRLTRAGLTVPRLARVTPAPAAAFRARDGHAYLVSGGLGGLGAHLIEWLLEHGARHIVSASRREPDAAQAASLAKLAQRHGARIDPLTVDVSDLTGLRDALPRTLGGVPLAGVFHAAGVLEDRAFAQHDWADARAVLSPKGAGAWHLHLTTLGEPLDHFVVCSSLSSLLGQPGQAAYALANALAEAVVAHRRARGLPALAIQWGPWAGTGMAARGGDALAAQHRAIGLCAHAAQAYLRVLADWLSPGTSAAPDALVGVFDLDWRRHAATYTPTPLWAALASESEAAPPGATPAGADRFVDQLAKVAPDARHRALRAHLRGIVADCLGGTDPTSIADTDGFAEIGIDSLHATVLHRRLEREFGASLPSTVAFDYPTVAAVADFLSRGPLTPLFVASPAEAGTRLTERSADELARILERELEGFDAREAW